MVELKNKIQLPVHDLALLAKPSIRQSKEIFTEIAARLIVGYFEAKKDQILYSDFERDVWSYKKKGGKGSGDFLRRYLYWGIYDAIADEFGPGKGLLDLTVATMHVMIRLYQSVPGAIITVESVLLKIQTHEWGKVQRGMEACWSEHMAILDALSTERQQQDEMEKQAFARFKEQERIDNLKTEAAKLDISLDKLLELRQQETDAKNLEQHQAALKVVKQLLVQNGVDSRKEKFPQNGIYLKTDDHLIRLSEKDEERIMSFLITSHFQKAN